MLLQPFGSLCEVPEGAKHADFLASVFAATEATLTARLANLANLLFFPGNAARQRRCTDSAPVPSERPEAERRRRDANLDQERRERGCEADHGGGEQDGYGYRQVDRDVGARKQGHHDEGNEECGYRTESDRDVYVMRSAH